MGFKRFRFNNYKSSGELQDVDRLFALIRHEPEFAPLVNDYDQRKRHAAAMDAAREDRAMAKNTDKDLDRELELLEEWSRALDEGVSVKEADRRMNYARDEINAQRELQEQRKWEANNNALGEHRWEEMGRMQNHRLPVK
jgi:hypothetical protein